MTPSLLNKFRVAWLRVFAKPCFRGRSRIKRWRIYLVICVAGLLLMLSLLFRCFPFPADRLIESQSPASALILDQKGGLVSWRVDPRDNWRLPVPLARISPWVVPATIATEDKRFRSHRGVDPVAILRALGQDVVHRRRVSGASTLTMQTIRLLWPRPRTLGAKAVEAFRALQLERIASKDRILELYLNLAPYGGNVIGVEAAARRYFNKHAADLSVGEAALLAGLPQSPGRFNPETHLSNALVRREYVLRRMRELGWLTPAQLAAALREPIRLCRPAVTADVPGFADYVLTLRHGQGGIIPTTLDPAIQSVVSETVQQHARDFLEMGIDGAAVVVIDVPSASLAAMVGTINARDGRTGCVNAALAKRQPGSLMKPFLYAAAFDRGRLTPGSLVYDVPGAWGDYRPQNMDREFLGPLPVTRALLLSRNIPAVALLDQLGPARLANGIRRLGLAIPAAEERCGLSLALGTGEVSLLDVANAYAALARLGRYVPLRILQNETPAAGTPVYSPGAAYLLVRALGAAAENEPARLIWKTGTSWQYRDAWAVAMTPRHVVGVWCGKLGGTGHAALIGLHTAQPLAVDVARRVSGSSLSSWPRPPAVRTRPVCSLSGAPPGDACSRITTAEFLPGTSSEVPCTLHRFEGSGNARRAAVVWPKSVADFLSTRTGQLTESQPGPLTIRAPVEGAEYILTDAETLAGRRLDFSVQPENTVNGAKKVFWFLNDRLTAVTAGADPFSWPMTPGVYNLAAADDRGRAASVSFRVTAFTAK